MTFSMGKRFYGSDAEWQAILERAGKWRPWFAWKPVRLMCGKIAWLEIVERRAEWWAGSSLAALGSKPGWQNEYRLPENKS